MVAIASSQRAVSISVPAAPLSTRSRTASTEVASVTFGSRAGSHAGSRERSSRKSEHRFPSGRHPLLAVLDLEDLGHRHLERDVRLAERLVEALLRGRQRAAGDHHTDDEGTTSTRGHERHVVGPRPAWSSDPDLGTLVEGKQW